MGDFPWIIIGIIVGLILVGVILVIMLKQRKDMKTRETDYHTFFILGVTFLPMGIIYEIFYFIWDMMLFLVLGLAFIAMGIIYLAIGLTNRDKWQKEKPRNGGDG